MIKVYKVGGCVRDELLGIKPKDIDFVVTGATPEYMLENGFKQVGASFPVFLLQGCEYALARTERKTGDGHKGFDTFFHPNVTIEDDLMRRDLTINAIAVDEYNNIIDPYGGQKDLKDGILRHISPAFEDDPLRILRVARFAATYDFNVHSNTYKLMTKMVKRNDLSTLSKERIVGEIMKAMSGDYYWRFFEVLDTCGAYKKLFKGTGRYYDATEVWIDMMAVANNLNVNQRIALFFLQEGKLKKHLEIMDNLGFSNETRDLVVFSNKLLDMISDTEENDTRGIFKKVKFILQSDKTGLLLPQTMSIFRLFDMDISLLAYFVKEARKVKFQHLSEQQRRTLEGVYIQKALDKLIMEKILNIHMAIQD